MQMEKMFRIELVELEWTARCLRCGNAVESSILSSIVAHHQMHTTGESSFLSSVVAACQRHAVIHHDTEPTVCELWVGGAPLDSEAEDDAGGCGESAGPGAGRVAASVQRPGARPDRLVAAGREQRPDDPDEADPGADRIDGNVNRPAGSGGTESITERDEMAEVTPQGYGTRLGNVLEKIQEMDTLDRVMAFDKFRKSGGFEKATEDQKLVLKELFQIPDGLYP